MRTRHERWWLALGMLSLVLSGGCWDAERRADGEVAMGSPDAFERLELDDAEWRRRLTALEYDVMRQQGTERPFSGGFVNTNTVGTYRCKGCGLALFRSDAKFDAGCGWPSFFEPLEGAHLEETRDARHGMVRTEVSCRRCGAHLGHVFNDGPPPTGLRYCINSVCLDLEADDESDR